MAQYTQKDIEVAKAKYSRCVRELEVYPSDTLFDEKGKADQEPAKFLIKKPNKVLMDLLGSKDYKNDTEKANQAIVSNCIIKGDLELMENDASIYTGVLEQLAGLIQSSRVSLKKV